MNCIAAVPRDGRMQPFILLRVFTDAYLHQLKRKQPACAGRPVFTVRDSRRSVVALGQVVVGHHFGGGPFQGFTLGALAL